MSPPTPNSNPQTLLLLGSGPGIGLASAKLFATRSHFSKIILISRDSVRLQQEKNEVEEAVSSAGKAHVEVEAIAADLGDLKALKGVLDGMELGKGGLGCVLFNAARIRPSEVLSAGWEEMEEDFRVSSFVLFNSLH